MKPETKVGLMVLLSVGGLFAVIVWLKGGVGPLMGKRHPFKLGVVFSTLGDLKSDAPVKFQEGPEIGRVQKIEIDPKDRRTKVWIGIDREFVPLLSRNARIRITTQGLLGEKYINIVPARPGEAGDEPLRAGSIVEGDEEGTLANLQSQAMTLMKTLQSTLSGLDRAINDLVPRLAAFADRANKLADAVTSHEAQVARRVTVLSEQLVELAKRLNQIVAKSEPGVDAALESAQKTAEDLRLTAEALRKAAVEIQRVAGDPKVAEDVRQIVAGAKTAVTDISKLTGRMEGLKTELGYEGQYIASGGAAPIGYGTPDPATGTVSGRLVPVRGGILNKIFLRISPSERKYYLLGLSNLGGRTSLTQETFYQDGRLVTRASGPLRPTFDVLYAQSVFRGFFLRGGLLEDTGSVGVDWRLLSGLFNVQADVYGLGGQGALTRAGAYLRPGPLRIGGLVDRIGRGDQNVRVGVGIELEDPDLRYVIGLLGLSASLYK